MALPDITQRLKLQAEGVKETETSSANIHKNLAGAAKAADALARAQSDSRRKAAAQSPRENLEYNQMRGTAGVTGAAARDFADQSRGLGPLIRLYAAFAANVFALSAAFGVLRNAADTSNLIEGLNTLGAVSGKALGTVAKQLTQASDGAISLRDAMSSVAMTSSAGMTSQNILRLGAVAKSASLALGVNMPDALNRLSRGIVKLEPELLDELGIFTKIEPATQAYALQLGKAVSQLTDFERRQAFANAVLKEGEEKFAALADAKANPYDKLLASLQNVAFSGLELLNTVLKPIVEVLASSPTALALGLAAVIAAILKRAIPAVADLRAAFGKKLQDSIDETQTKIEGLKNSYKQLAEYSVKQASEAADARVDKVVAAEKKILDFYKQNAKVGPQGALLTASPQFQTIIKENPLELDQQALTKLKAAHADYLRQVSSGNQKLTSETKERIKLEAEFIKVLEEQLAGEQSFSTLRTKALQQAEEAAKNSRLGISLEKDIQALKLKGRKDEIVQMAVSRANTLGVGIAWKLLKIDIDNASTSIEKFAARTALIQGAIGIVGGKLLSTLNGVGSALTAISIGAAVFAVFESLFSKNEKQMQAFKASIDAANESTLNTKRTLAELDRAGLGKSLTDTAISLSNAFAEISSSAQKLVVDARLAKEASTGFFDTIVEGFKDFFGYGIDDQVAKGLSKQLISALDILRRSNIDEKYREQFKQLLQVKDLSAGTVEKALSTLGEDVRNRFTSLLESARKELDKTRSDLESFKDASDKAVKSYQEFLQSTANTNPLFKLGESMEILADGMISAMNRGTLGIQAAFEELSKDPKKAALFGKEFIQQFVAVEQGFKDQSNALRIYTGIQKQLQQELEETRQKEKELREEREKTGRVIKTRDERILGRKAESLEKDLAAKKDAIIQLPTDQIEKGRELFAKGLDIAFARGAEYIRVALGQAAEKAGITIAKANSMVLSGERAAEESTRIRLQEIDIQINAVKVNLDLIRENELLQSELAALRASVDYARVSADQNATAEEKRVAYENKVATGLVASILSGRVTQAEAVQQAGAYSKSDEILSVPGGVDPKMITRQVNAAVGAVRRKEGEQQARLIELGGEKRAAGIEGQIQKERQRLEDRNKLLRIENETNQVIAARSGLLQGIAGLTTQQVIAADAQSERQAMINRQSIELSTIELARNQADAKFDETKQVKFQQEAAYQQKLYDATRDKNAEDLKNLDIRTKQRQTELTIQDIQKRAELEKSARDTIIAQEETRLEIQRAQFTSAAELYDLDKKFIINKTAELDIERANFDAIKQRGEIEANLGTKRLETEARVKALGLEGIALAAKLTEEQQRITDIANNQLAALEAERQKRLEILEIQRQQALKQAEISYRTEQAAKLADALGGAFGNVGTKLGSIVTTIIESNIKQQQGQEALKKIQQDILNVNQKIQASQGSEEEIGFINEKQGLLDAEAKKKKQINDDELAGNAKALGSMKTMFKQHTAAYKTLAALEKAYHIMRMVNMGIEMVTSVKKAAVEVSSKATSEAAQTMLQINGMMTRMPFMIGEIYGKTFGQLGIFGPPVAAALVALAFGSMGRGKGGGGFVPNAEQRQETQGTAMGYNEKGQKVQVRRGVFGDTDAKSEAISRGIEKIKETSVDGLSVNNQMLSVLQSIDNGINNTAKSLVRVSGLATGSMFNTVEGTQSGRGLFGTGIFASKTTKEIQDSGIVIQGSFAELASTANKTALEFFEQLKVTKKKWYGKTKTSIENNYKEVDDDVSRYFTQVFTSAGRLIKDVAQRTGTATIDEVNSVLNQAMPETKISFRGKTGEEIKAEVEAVLGSLISDASAAIFSEFEQFADFGEDLLLTVVRVTDTNEKIAQQILNLGGTIDLLNKFDITESLADAAGGFDEFLKQTEFFRDNFLTEAERLAPVQKALVEDLKRLGLESVDTKEEFKQLVQSIKPVDKASIDLYTTLLKLAPAFQKVYDESSNAVAKLLKDLNNEILELESTSSPLEKAIAEISTKASEYVETLYQAKQATAENIAVIARWTKAATLKELRAQLKTTFEDRKRELESSISALEKIKTSLVDFKTQLLQGNLSPLSDLDKFSQLRTEYDKLLQDVRSSDSAVAEKAAEKFPALSQQLLTAASTLYGSGELYQTLHKSILADLDTTTEIVNTKLTDAQRQLELLTAQGITLGLIEANTKTTAQKFTELVTLYNAVNAVNPTTVGQTAAASIQAGNTATSSLSNAFTEQLKIIAPDIIVTPLELTPEAKAAAAAKAAAEKAAAEKAAAEKAAAEAAAKKAAEDAAKAAAEIKAAIDAQTVVLSQVLTNTSDNVVDEIKTTKYVNVGSFGKTQNLLAPMQER